MVGVGFEPTKPKHQILSLTPLTARESNLGFRPQTTGEGTNAPYRDRTYDLTINSRAL